MSLGLSLAGRTSIEELFGYDSRNENMYKEAMSLATKLANELEEFGITRHMLLSDRVSFQDIFAIKEKLYEKYGKESKVLTETYDVLTGLFSFENEYTEEERKEFIKWYRAL